jgi:hypothetical protein
MVLNHFTEGYFKYILKTYMTYMLKFKTPTHGFHLFVDSTFRN